MIAISFRDESPVGHLRTNDTHFYSVGCFRCHDGQHKRWTEASFPPICTCHTILGQGKAGASSTPQGARATFKHPLTSAVFGHHSRAVLPYGRIVVTDHGANLANPAELIAARLFPLYASGTCCLMRSSGINGRRAPERCAETLGKRAT